MKRLNRISIAIAFYTLVVVASLGTAHAGHVTVKYQTFPPSTILDSNEVTGCDTATANTYSGYQFEFWDNQGTISFSSTVSICSRSGNTVAIAWYLPTGSCPPGQTCGCPPSGCYVTTMAYSTNHHEFLASGTSIALVTPNSPVAWPAGSTTVNTSYAIESISAMSALAFPPHAAEPFRFWQEMGTPTPTPIGVVYLAGLNSTGLVVSFYGPDPCQTLRTELQTCTEEFPGDPKACAPIAAALTYCEKQNRELP